jgi:hypothetical protein
MLKSNEYVIVIGFLLALILLKLLLLIIKLIKFLRRLVFSDYSFSTTFLFYTYLILPTYYYF